MTSRRKRVPPPGRRPPLERCPVCRHRATYDRSGSGRYVTCADLACGIRTPLISLSGYAKPGWTLADHYRELEHRAAAIWNRRSVR
jgi:hypothetical protein